MDPTIFALLLAVATLFAYHALTERLDYSSVARRQMDAWAAISALLCLLGIAYGGHAARQRAAADEASLSLVMAPTPILRSQVPDLRTPAMAQPPLGEPQWALETEGRIETLRDAAAESVDSGAPAGEARRESGDARYVSQEDLAGEGETEAEGRLIEATPIARQSTTLLLLPPQATPTLQRVVTRVPAALTARPPTQVAILPTATALPPTSAPELPVDPTPVCGDPTAIRVGLNILEAKVDRDSEPQAVRYRVRIENDAAFPIVASNIVVTAQDSRSGSDQFGSDRPSNVRMDGRHSVEIEGAVLLDKQPSPFGRSELCVSFVADSCGRQAPFPITRRCYFISGF